MSDDRNPFDFHLEAFLTAAAMASAPTSLAPRLRWTKNSLFPAGPGTSDGTTWAADVDTVVVALAGVGTAALLLNGDPIPAGEPAGPARSAQVRRTATSLPS